MRPTSEQFSVLDKTGAVADALVEHTPLVVAFLSQPMHATGTGSACLGVNVLDQRAADAATANVLGDEQILQVAVVTTRPATAVIVKCTRPTASPSCQARAA